MQKTQTLNHLKAGQICIVAGITGTGPFFTRLRSLGVRPNSEIKMIQKAPFGGDPLCIHVSGSRLAMRREEAEHILCFIGKP